MITGISRRTRRRGQDRKFQRGTSSRVFEQFCPTMRRTGRCALYEAQVARANEVLAKRKAALQENEAAAELFRQSTDAGDEGALDDAEIDLLLEREPLPSVELWHECPFQHQRSAIAKSERSAIVDRLVEFFALGKVNVTLRREDADPDADPELVARSPTVSCAVPTRRGRVLIASQFAARFGAYLGLEDAPPQYVTDERQGDGSETLSNEALKREPVTGLAGPTAQASAAISTAHIFTRRRRRIQMDVAEFRTCAELNLKSVRVCDYLATAVAILRSRGVQIDGIIVSRNELQDLEPLLSALKKHKLHEHIHFLDASDNELQTLRFLFLLRSSFPQLLSLRLLNNPITRKPEYREQLRKTLPLLMRLDDESVRRPPLALPFPKPSASAHGQNFSHATRFVYALLDSFERDLVDEDFVQRHFHPSVTYSLSVHPDCAFVLPSYVMTAEQQAAREKQSDIEKGKRHRRKKECYLVTPQDAREAELFNVSLKSASRDLRVGKQAVQKFARGQLAALTAYVGTLYPPRFPASHHLHFAEWDVDCFPVPLATLSTKVKRLRQSAAKATKDAHAMPAPVRKTKAPKLPTVTVPDNADDDDATAGADEDDLEAARHRTVFVPSTALEEFEMVTLHGVMTWRIASVHGETAFRCFYDRTLTLVKRPGIQQLPPIDPTDAQNAGRWGSEDDLIDALDAYCVYNDQVTLRPVLRPDQHDVHRRDVGRATDAQCRPNSAASSAVFDARRRPEYVRRLATVFNLDEPAVRTALEQASSDACLMAVLEDAAGVSAGELAVEHIDDRELAADEDDSAERVVRKPTSLANDLATALLAGGAPPVPAADDSDDDPLDRTIAQLGREGSVLAVLQPALQRHRTEPFTLPRPEPDA